MNAPRIAKFLRKTGFFIAKLARPFTPEDESEQRVKNLIKGLQLSHDFESLTDHQMGKVAARMIDIPFTHPNSAVIAEVVDRLLRSKRGSNRLTDEGKRMIGLSPGLPILVRLIPNLFCDECGAIGYIDDKANLCLHCLAVRVKIESRRQKISPRNAKLLSGIREKLREFEKSPNSPGTVRSS